MTVTTTSDQTQDQWRDAAPGLRTLKALPRNRTTGAVLPQLPDWADGTRLTVVAPDAVPPGAVVVGVVIAAQGPWATPPPVGGEHLSAPLLCGPDLLLDRAGRRVTRDGQDLPLTRREFDLLEHLASRPGRVCTREHLLHEVWQFEHLAYTPPRTVDVHVARLRRKLGPQHAAALHTLRGVGYRWTGQAARPRPAAADR